MLRGAQMAENFSLRRATEPLLRMARPHYGARANAREALNDIRADIADRAAARAAVTRARTRGVEPSRQTRDGSAP